MPPFGIISPMRESTPMFAAVAAQISRLVRPYDAAHVDRLLDAARRAFDVAEKRGIQGLHEDYYSPETPILVLRNKDGKEKSPPVLAHTMVWAAAELLPFSTPHSTAWKKKLAWFPMAQSLIRWIGRATVRIQSEISENVYSCSRIGWVICSRRDRYSPSDTAPNAVVISSVGFAPLWLIIFNAENVPPEPPSVEFLSRVPRAQRSLYAFILTLVRQAADAEDVLQETNVVLWRKAGEYRPDSGFHALGVADRPTPGAGPSEAADAGPHDV